MKDCLNVAVDHLTTKCRRYRHTDLPSNNAPEFTSKLRHSSKSIALNVFSCYRLYSLCALDKLCKSYEQYGRVTNKTLASYKMFSCHFMLRVEVS